MTLSSWSALILVFATLARCGFLSALSACPEGCEVAADSSGWTMYSRVNRLEVCNETMLLDFALHSKLSNPEIQPRLFACTVNDNERVGLTDSSSCGTTSDFDVSLDLVWSGEGGSANSDTAIMAVEAIRQYLQDTNSCKTNIKFAYAQKTVAGIYVGSQIHPESIADDFLPKVVSYLKDTHVPRRVAFQHCTENIDRGFGVVIDMRGDLAGVQDIVKGWSTAACPSNWEHCREDWSEMTLQAFEQSSQRHPKLSSSLVAQVEGDKPKPEADGTCASYKTIPKDTCYEIAKSNQITVKDIESFNKDTWGWSGCGSLGFNQIICLSKGDPPMPAEYSNAVCGPQVPGTKKPTNGTKLADLNPCKLNACCNIWGQCGITDDFCDESESSKNRCISNCGNDVKDGGDTLPDFRYIAYFEGWNFERPCMNMDVTDMSIHKGGYYTGIHFAFANITDDMEVDVTDVQFSFNAFAEMDGYKRVLSFGGWAFSTAPETFPIFRDGVTDDQRQKFADNVVDFLKLHDLDGLDFDWEYPGAPDLPGIPAGGPDEGANYVKFLKMVKKQLPKGKTLSVAMPASYWYLLGFHPITDFAEVVDYVIYMTYDLHGQWDYGSPWSVDGCPNGDCLRSHVNRTETKLAMRMLQKAGMPTEKIVIGTPSYGRSFKMTQEGCSGPMCTYTGPESGARKGRCTDTAGYIGTAEIMEIISTNPDHNLTFDEDSKSSILVYDKTEYVSWLDEAHKAIWLLDLQKRGWGGVSDWAVDLKDMYTEPNDEDIEMKFCDDSFDTLGDLSEAGDDVPGICIDIYALNIMNKDFKKAMKKYDELIDSGYDGKFNKYAKYINETMYEELEHYMFNHAEDRFHCTDAHEHDETVDCPTKRPEILGRGPGKYTYHLDDEKGFYKDIMDQYGIDESWIRFGKLYVWTNAGCHPQDAEGAERCSVYWYGFPQRDEEHMKVPNPKETISLAMKNVTDFGDQLDEAAANAAAFLYTQDIADAIEAAEMPVFMCESAVQQMQKVIDAADEIAAAEKKAMIVNFAAAFLMLVPAVGETIGVLGMATIGRVVMLAGEVGNAAYGVYGVVEDPASAVFSIFGAIIGIRGELGFQRAAEARRGMSNKENTVLGKFVQDRMDSVKMVQQKSCKA
ncbi:Glycoside hydrolase superfamily [Penicillium sp. DV-2018c]|nr:Glycoside hydrolase superfamily [Penicillium sp. DV-2018c]